MKYINEKQAYEMYDEMLDKRNDVVKIGELKYLPSQVFKEVDPVAYRCGFWAFLNGEKLTIFDADNWFDEKSNGGE